MTGLPDVKKMSDSEKREFRYRAFINRRDSAIKDINEMFLPQRIAAELYWWVESETWMPLMLYGVGGNGKTTVSRILSRMFCIDEHSMYRDMSMRTQIQDEIDAYESFIGRNWGFENMIYGYKHKNANVRSFIILDEFHNVGNKDQSDKFKGLLCKDYLSQVKTRVVICCNTTADKDLESLFRDPILSRCNKLCFNLLRKEKEEVAKSIIEQYQYADEATVLALLPDYRQVKLYLEKAEYNYKLGGGV